VVTPLEHLLDKSNHPLPRPTTRSGRTTDMVGVLWVTPRGSGLEQRKPDLEML